VPQATRLLALWKRTPRLHRRSSGEKPIKLKSKQVGADVGADLTSPNEHEQGIHASWLKDSHWNKRLSNIMRCQRSEKAQFGGNSKFRKTREDACISAVPAVPAVWVRPA
jgi:hypothetical protein